MLQEHAEHLTRQSGESLSSHQIVTLCFFAIKLAPEIAENLLHIYASALAIGRSHYQSFWLYCRPLFQKAFIRSFFFDSIFFLTLTSSLDGSYPIITPRCSVISSCVAHTIFFLLIAVLIPVYMLMPYRLIS